MSVLGAIGAFAGGALNKFVDLGINMIGTKYANDLNLKNWYRQMDYNSPIAQLARLREAGLNPNLIYGSGGVQNTISGAPKMESPGSAPFDLMAYQQVKNGETQNELMQQQKRVAEAQEDNLQTRTAGEILKNVYQSLDNQYKNYENQHYFNTGTVKGGGIDRLIDRAVNMGEKYNPLGPLFRLAGSIYGYATRDHQPIVYKNPEDDPNYYPWWTHFRRNGKEAYDNNYRGKELNYR